MSCFCFLREGHRELVANNNVLSVYFALSTLTSAFVGGVASEPKGMTSVLLVYYLLWSFPRILGSRGERVSDDLWKFTTNGRIKYREKEYVLSRFKLHHCSMFQ